MSRKPMVVALASAAAAIAAEAFIAPRVIDANYHGASGWLLWLIAVPLLLPIAAIGVWARLDSRRAKAVIVAPAVRQWHVIDEELSEERSTVEREMERRHRATAIDAWNRPWPENLAWQPADRRTDQ